MAKKEWKQRLIPKKALFRASLIWETWVQTCYNYERMMGMACAHTFLPVVKYLYPDNKEKQIDVMTREMEFLSLVHVSLVWLFLLKRKKLWATIFRMNSLQISRLP